MLHLGGGDGVRSSRQFVCSKVSGAEQVCCHNSSNRNWRCSFHEHPAQQPANRLTTRTQACSRRIMLSAVPHQLLGQYDAVLSLWQALGMACIRTSTEAIKVWSAIGPDSAGTLCGISSLKCGANGVVPEAGKPSTPRRKGGDDSGTLKIALVDNALRPQATNSSRAERGTAVLLSLSVLLSGLRCGFKMSDRTCGHMLACHSAILSSWSHSSVKLA